jgi:hypothetical protein
MLERVDDAALELLDDRRLGIVTRADRPDAGTVDDVRIEGHRIAVHHRHDGVQMHVVARGRQLDCEHEPGRAGLEQLARDHRHRLRRGPLAHADHHGAVADRHDVAAFDRRAAPVLVDAAVPDVHAAGLDEHRMEPVNGLHEDGLRTPCRLLHRVDGHAVVDPARAVALEQEVGQRRQQEVAWRG